MFVNVTTKSAQHAHARMIAIIVEESINSSHLYNHGFMDNTNRQAVKNWLNPQTSDTSRQPFCQNVNLSMPQGVKMTTTIWHMLTIIGISILKDKNANPFFLSFSLYAHFYFTRPLRKRDKNYVCNPSKSEINPRGTHSNSMKTENCLGEHHVPTELLSWNPVIELSHAFGQFISFGYWGRCIVWLTMLMSALDQGIV